MDGKTEKDGFTAVSGTFGDNAWELVRKGDKAALNTPDAGWESLADMEREEGAGRFRAVIVRNFRVPAIQAAEIAATTKELKKDGDLYSGELTEAGAKALLTFRPRGRRVLFGLLGLFALPRQMHLGSLRDEVPHVRRMKR